MRTYSLMAGLFIFLVGILISPTASAEAPNCDSSYYLNGANSKDNGIRENDGFLLYFGRSPNTAEVVCVTEKTKNNDVLRYVVERVFAESAPITLTHGFQNITARAYPDTLAIDPDRRESTHVVAQCGANPGEYHCDAFPDPMSMMKIRTYYSQSQPGRIEFTLNAPRPEIRRAFKIDHALSTQPAEMQLPNGKIVRFLFARSGGFVPAPQSASTVYEFLQTAPDPSILKISVPVVLNNGQSTLMKTEVTIGQIKLASQISDLTGQVYAKRPLLNEASN